MSLAVLADGNDDPPPDSRDWRRTSLPMNVTERRLFRLLGMLGEDVVPQARVGPWTVDFLLPRVRVVIESDSRLFHARLDRQRADRLRDADLQARGYLTVHVWSDRLFADHGDSEILRHVRFRVYRGRGEWLGGPGAERQLANLRERAGRLTRGPARIEVRDAILR